MMGTLTAVGLSLLWSAAVLASSQPVTICGTDGLLVARMIVQRELGAVPDNVDMLAINDVHCSPRFDTRETPHMANVVVATVAAEQRLFSIFHVHFATDGTVHSLARVQPWGERREDEWRDAWCHFIRTVYAAEASVQGCEPSVRR